MTPNVLVLSVRPAGVFDGVGDFAASLAVALAGAGVSATPLSRARLGTWAALPEADGRGIILNYVPQSFLHADLAVLLGWLTRARASGSAVVLVIHEFLPPRDTLRRRVASLFLGQVLAQLLRRATAAVVTHQVARDELAALGFAPVPVVIPVGSGIPARIAAHARAEGALVMFGQPASFVPSLVRAIAAQHHGGPAAPVVWLTRSGPEADAFVAHHGIDARGLAIRAGLDAGAISHVLSSSSAALAPIVDGVSTRRTSVAAALAHGLPVAGTDGACTTDVFRGSAALLLSPPGADAAFVAHAGRVARGDDWAMMSQAATRLHDEVFGWPRIAAAYAELVRTS